MRRSNFFDPTHPDAELVLVDGVGVEHPGCTYLAAVFAHLDAYYCNKCGWNGRISGLSVARVLNEDA